jgi:hypothetical protein
VIDGLVAASFIVFGQRFKNFLHSAGRQAAPIVPTGEGN